MAVRPSAIHSMSDVNVVFRHFLGSDSMEKFYTQLRGGFSRLMLILFRKANNFKVILKAVLQ